MDSNSRSVFFFNDTATTEIYTLSLHDALPILLRRPRWPPSTSPSEYRSWRPRRAQTWIPCVRGWPDTAASSSATLESRSEEHTSELQSRQYLVCRLLLEKKNIYNTHSTPI